MSSKILDVHGRQIQDPEFSAQNCFPDITEGLKSYTIDAIRHNHVDHMIMTYNVNGSGYRARKITEALDAVEESLKARPTVILIQELK